MTIYTIGFTQKSAREFFDRLRRAEVRRVVDIRLNNTSQLAGFAKAADLAYFLEAILGIEYVHMPMLAPTREILDAYKKRKAGWAEYERDFTALMTERQIEHAVRREDIEGACLLCSEHTPEHCHRRLVAEHFAQHWRNVEVVHL